MKKQANYLLSQTDWLALALVLTLCSIGLLFIFSATYRPECPVSLFFKKQLSGVLAGIGLFFLFSCIDYRTLQRWGYWLYIVLIALLCYTLIKGSIGMGAQRWINIGFAKFQPSEVAKLLFPAYATHYLWLHTQKQPSFTSFVPLLGLLLVSTILIFKQPDLGTAILVGTSGLILLWLAGLSKRFFFALTLFFIIIAPLAWNYLRPYQKQRILVLLGQGEKHKERYHLEQSIIAIGSGGITGKGLLEGTQNKFQFLPESRTDFIFAVICEEAGLMGALLVIFLYLCLVLRIFWVISSIKNSYVILLAVGITIPLLLSCIINMAMVMGLLPIVGIPLPFLSYGITHLLISFASIGWYNSIVIRRWALSNLITTHNPSSSS